MKKKYIAAAGALLLSLPLCAQDIYKVESFSSEDLNGTARYVGMGGAMNALGADISTMGSNPAGIGLFRKSSAALTGSLVIEPDAEDFNDKKKTRGSFDQIGFVFAMPVSGKHLKFVNFGFNYQKRKNLKNFIGLYGAPTGGASQAFSAANLGNIYGDYSSQDADGNLSFDMPLTDAAYNSYMINPGGTSASSDSYDYRRGQYGSLQQYDLNFSMNFDNRIYAGFTLGIYNVDWNSYLEYTEYGVGGVSDDGSGNPIYTSTDNYYRMYNDEKVDGTGVDFKLGLIVRPIEDNPFRFGLSFSSPTWYNLTGNNVLRMSSPFYTASSTNDYTNAGYNTGDFDYKIRTPWKLNVSLATTVGKWLALDAEYEYKHLPGAGLRWPDYGSGYYDYWGDYWEDSYADKAVNHQIDKYLKGQSTFRIGAEARLSQDFSVRLGYNYVSAPFEDDAFLNLYPSAGTNYYDSESLMNATGTDYVNLGATNRVTCGLGYHGKHFFADLAYQYQHQDADVYPFHDTDVYSSNEDFAADRGPQAQSFDLKRHQVMLTLGWKF